MSHLALFGNHIAPACEYCAECKHGAEPSVFTCPFAGSVKPYHHCERFVYAPLRRSPRRTPKLPSFSPDEFKL